MLPLGRKGRFKVRLMWGFGDRSRRCAGFRFNVPVVLVHLIRAGAGAGAICMQVQKAATTGSD